MFNREFVEEDLKRHLNYQGTLKGLRFWSSLITSLLRSPIFFRIFVLRHKQWCKKKNLPSIPFLGFIATVRTFNGIQINTLDVGKGLKIQHGTSIVIGSGVKIGDYLTVLQQVTIGNRDMEGEGRFQYPVIGNNVHIGAGANIIGDVRIGDGAKIGANALVVRDVPPKHVAVGIPARVVKSQ